MRWSPVPCRPSKLNCGTFPAHVKVLLLGTGIYSIPPTGYGAVERIIGEFSQALTRAGQQASVLNEVRHGRSRDEYWFALHLPTLLRRVEYDVVHASTPVVANRLAGLGVPFVYTSHSRHWFWRTSWRHRWGYWLERRAVRRSSASVALTSDVAAAMHRTVPASGRVLLRVIPFGVNADEFRPAWDLRTGRRALGVGLVRPLKQWEIAAAALKGTGISLTIAGPTPDPEYAARVREAGDEVQLLGEVEEPRLKRLYSESDFLVHPSKVEVLPRAVLEAMASGLPVLGSSVVGSFLLDGRCGRAAPPSAAGAELVRFFRDAAQDLVHDADLRRRMGEAGQVEARTTYSWERIVAAHLDLYREVGASGANRPGSRPA